MSTYKHGLRVEAIVKRAILALPFVKQVEPDKRQLLTNVCPVYRDKVLHYLKQEGYQHWGTVPVEVILDRLYGIDLLVSVKGYVHAFDITSTRLEYGDKRKKVLDRKKRGLYDILGLDSLTILVSENKPAIDEKIFANNKIGALCYV